MDLGQLAEDLKISFASDRARNVVVGHSGLWDLQRFQSCLSQALAPSQQAL